MQIRNIESKDNHRIAEIIRHALVENKLDIPGTAYFDPELEKLSDYYKIPGRSYYVVVNDKDEPVGGAGFAEYIPDQKIAELQKLYLSPEVRGHHLGEQLVLTVEKMAKAAGYEKIALETHSNLKAAIHLYKKLGYTKLNAPLTNSTGHNAMDQFYIKTL